MIDDRLRAAARELSDRVVAEPPPLGRRRPPVAPFVLGAGALLAGGLVVRAAVDRDESVPPAISTATEPPATTALATAAIPFVPCREQAPAAPPPSLTPNPGTGAPPVLPGGMVLPDGGLLCGDERTAIIESLLVDVPIPPKFEVPAYGTTGPSWFGLINEVSSAVACAWLDEWFVASDAGDATGMKVAAAALDTVREWDMVNRDFMGERAEYLGRWADAVNGRGGVGPTPELDVPPTRELAESALVCTWQHR